MQISLDLPSPGEGSREKGSLGRGGQALAPLGGPDSWLPSWQRLAKGGKGLGPRLWQGVPKP